MIRKLLPHHTVPLLNGILSKLLPFLALLGGLRTGLELDVSTNNFFCIKFSVTITLPLQTMQYLN